MAPLIVDSDELGYDCPEIGAPNLDEEEDQTLGRARTLARRQLTQDQRRELIADQLEESPDRSNRWLAKQLGVSDRGGSARRFGGNWPNYSVGPDRGAGREVEITIPRQGQPQTEAALGNRSGIAARHESAADSTA